MEIRSGLVYKFYPYMTFLILTEESPECQSSLKSKNCTAISYSTAPLVKSIYPIFKLIKIYKVVA